jgi:GH15 family glucan-1,4-alpha-glucosidase
LTTHNLFQRSIDIIKENQAPSGAYIASPNFENYAFCWLRDGSFTAHAMDVVGEYESARRFYRWVDTVIRRYASKGDHIERSMRTGTPLRDTDFLHTRYTLQGEEEQEDKYWGRFQLDGYGTWLWAVAQHARLSGDTTFWEAYSDSIELTVRYISLVYRLPNYDIWEENPHYLHTYSLGAAYGGLSAVAGVPGVPGRIRSQASETAQAIRDFIHQYSVIDGRLAKFIQPSTGNTSFKGLSAGSVDTSLIGLCTPYAAFPSDHPVMRVTLEQVENALHRNEGGVYRYLEDTYYGGGEWVLLAGWLGWHYARNGCPEKAAALQRWIERQADQDGNLPEQVSGHLLAPDYYTGWVDKWGPVANPLLWSHAMYLILSKTLQNQDPA